MGVAIPLGYVEDRSSGALVVDGSLRFTGSSYLKRTPGSTGNTTTYTISCWVKRSHLAPDGSGNTNSNSNPIFSAGTNAGSDTDDLQFYKDAGNNNAIRFVAYPGAFRFDLSTSMVFRDVSSWYHILANYDGTTAKIYINGTQVTAFASSTQNGGAGNINTTDQHVIGASCDGSTSVFRGYISQYYFVDGQALDPSYFGYTDALTNTWRPKKFKPQATPNNGTTWSSAGNFSGNVRSQGDSYGPPKMFNGIIGNESTTGAVCFAPYSSDSTCTWTSPTTFTGLTSLRLYVDLSGTTGKLTVNGVDYSSLVTALSGGDGWITIPQSSLSTISFGYTGGVNSATGIAAVEVNGVTLLDSDTTNIGTNGFYLPFDGSAPIGQDQSGRGNNWTPVNFGGSNTLEKATGALPILNTDGGGKVARVGVRTDSSASSLVLALPLVGVKDDVSNRINSGSTTKTVTATNAVASSAQSNFYGGSFYFDGSGDYLNAGTSTDFVFGTGQFTIEGWIYNQSYNGSNGGTGDSYPTIISTYSGETVNWIVRIYRTGALTWYSSDGGGTNNNSAGGLTQLNTWYHFAYVREGTGSNQFKMYLNGVLVHTLTDSNNYTANETVVIGSQSASNPRNYHTGYLQDFRIYKGLAKYTQNFIPASTDPDILPDTPSGVSYTSNVALVPSTDGAVSFDGASDYLNLGSSADYNVGTGDFTFECFAYYNTRNDYSGIFGPYTYSTNAILIQISNSSVLRLVNPGGIDVSGTTNISNRWVHIAVSRSGTTLRGFINGIQEISTTYSSSIDFANGGAAVLGVTDVSTYLGTYDFRGFISNVHFVKGTALYTSNFTPPTGPISSVANTKLLCCKSNSSATAADVTPGTITANGNAAATNFNPFTVNINTQRGKQSGWCTLNPLDVYGTVTFSNGNLTINPAIGSGNAAFGSLPVTSGKWYWEVTVNTDSALGSMIGITDYQYPVSRRSWYSTSGAQGWFYYADGSKYTPGNPYSASSYGSSYTTADVISIALNMDAGTCVMYKNGISQGTLTSTGLSGNLIGPALGQGQGGTSGQPVYSANFGQKPFKFPPPAGFQPLALANTPRPTIVRPDQYVGVSTWSGAQSGSGGLTRQISLGMQPDFVWIKQRNQAYSTGHQLYDSVRGAGAEKELNSSGTAAEGAGNIETYGWLNSFDKTGFTVKGGSSDYDYVDKSGVNYVGWAWKAGGNSNTYNINDVGYATASAAGLTAGTITPTGASVNTKSGFSIITYTGTGSGSATIDHGLGKKPQLIFVKKRNAISPWYTQHGSLGAGQIGYLNATDAFGASSGWNSTEPTNQVFSVASSLNDANTFVAYCWAEIPGFSKFGSYTGTDTSNYIHLGFRPALVIIKNATKTSSAFSSWMIQDAERSPYNPTSGSNKLWANRATQEGYRGDGSETSNLTANNLDFDSNGFYIPSSASTELNETGQTFIYAAWAETPTQNLYGAQANAR